LKRSNYEKTEEAVLRGEDTIRFIEVTLGNIRMDVGDFTRR
jgi:hypothetical protein